MKIGDSPPISRPLAEGQVHPENRAAGPKNSDTLLLPQGRLVKATVLSVSSGETALLSFGGKTLSVQTMSPLQAGQKLWLEVFPGAGGTLVAPAGKKGAVVDLMRLLFSFDPAGSPSPWSDGGKPLTAPLLPGQPKLAAVIEYFLKLYSASGIGAESDPAKILKAVSASGLFSRHLDVSLYDKMSMPQLLDLLMQHKGGGQDETQGLVRLLKLFDAFGQVNSLASGQDQPNFFLFPCFFAGNAGWGEWLFRFSRNKDGAADSDREYGVSMFLEMSNLGELYFQARLQDLALQGVFSVSDDGVVSHLSESLGSLSATLGNLGFKPVNLSCQKAKSSNMQRLKEEVLGPTGGESYALVDVTI